MLRNTIPKPFLLLILLSFILLSRCSKDDEPGLSPVLEEAFNIAQNNSLNRLTIDWTELRARVSQAENNGNFEQGIRALLIGLADNHSFYRRTIGGTIYESEISCITRGFDLTDLPDDIGYVRVDGFSGNSTEGVNLATSIQNSIAGQDGPHLKGWVVDLSRNLGGNMYPMVAGLGPFYNQEVLGFFIGPDGSEFPWGYANGSSFLSSRGNQQVTVAQPYELIDPNTKVVVIIDDATASSGEATTTSFIGRPNTLILGRPTCGLSTVNNGFPLSNGDTFILTVATMADRNRQTYGGEIMPDEVTNTSVELKARIIEWLDE